MVTIRASYELVISGQESDAGGVGERISHDWYDIVRSSSSHNQETGLSMAVIDCQGAVLCPPLLRLYPVICLI